MRYRPTKALSTLATIVIAATILLMNKDVYIVAGVNRALECCVTCVRKMKHKN